MQGIPFVSEQLHEGELVHSLEVARWDSFQFEEGPQSRGQDAQRDDPHPSRARRPGAFTTGRRPSSARACRIMTERNQLQHFVNTIPDPNLIPGIVGKEAGSVRSNGPELIKPHRRLAVVNAKLNFACSEILEKYNADGVAWLEKQWGALNESRPIVVLSYAHSAEESEKDPAKIDADLGLIAHVDHELYWGHVNNRPESFERIMGGLLQGFCQGSYDQWFQRMNHIRLSEIPGIYGPLYRISDDTRHRVHTVVGLHLDTFPAEITRMRQAPVIDLTHHTETRRGQPFFKRLTTDDVPVKMAKALVNAGYLAQLDATHFRVLEALPGPWLFSYTWDAIASASKRYQISYPQYGFTPLEKMSLDANSIKQFVKKNQK